MRTAGPGAARDHHYSYLRTMSVIGSGRWCQPPQAWVSIMTQKRAASNLPAARFCLCLERSC